MGQRLLSQQICVDMSSATLVTMEGKADSASPLPAPDRTTVELRCSSGVCVGSLQVPPENIERQRDPRLETVLGWTVAWWMD